MRRTEHCPSCYATVSVWKSLSNCFPEHVYLVKTINAKNLEQSSNAHEGKNVFHSSEIRDLYCRGFRDLGMFAKPC